MGHTRQTTHGTKEPTFIRAHNSPFLTQRKRIGPSTFTWSESFLRGAIRFVPHIGAARNWTKRCPRTTASAPLQHLDALRGRVALKTASASRTGTSLPRVEHEDKHIMDGKQIGFHSANYFCGCFPLSHLFDVTATDPMAPSLLRHTNPPKQQRRKQNKH